MTLQEGPADHRRLHQQRHRADRPQRRSRSSVTVRTTPYTTHERLVADLGVYAQDTWTIKRLTVNAGLRWDYLNNKVDAQDAPGGTWIGPRHFDELSDVPNYKDISPRARRRLRPVRQRQDRAQGDAQPLRADVHGGHRAPAQPPQHVGQHRHRGPGRRTRNHDGIPQVSELGPLSNTSFGQVNIATRYDPETITGFDHRRNNWEVSTTITPRADAARLGRAVVFPPRAGALHDHRQSRRRAVGLQFRTASRRRPIPACPTAAAIRSAASTTSCRPSSGWPATTWSLSSTTTGSRPRCSTASTSR